MSKKQKQSPENLFDDRAVEWCTDTVEFLPVVIENDEGRNLYGPIKGTVRNIITYEGNNKICSGYCVFLRKQKDVLYKIEDTSNYLMISYAIDQETLELLHDKKSAVDKI